MSSAKLREKLLQAFGVLLVALGSAAQAAPVTTSWANPTRTIPDPPEFPSGRVLGPDEILEIRIHYGPENGTPTNQVTRDYREVITGIGPYPDERDFTFDPGNCGWIRLAVTAVILDDDTGLPVESDYSNEIRKDSTGSDDCFPEPPPPPPPVLEPVRNVAVGAWTFTPSSGLEQPIAQASYANDQITVTWTDANASSYRLLYWYESEATPTTVNLLGTSYSYTPAAPGQYRHQVEAYDPQGNSLFSDPVFVDVPVPPEPPVQPPATGGVMPAVIGTPTAIAWAAGADPAAQAVTVPVGANALAMQWSYFGGVGDSLAGVTFDGRDPDYFVEHPTVSGEYAGGAAVWFHGLEPGSYDLDPVWDNAPGDGPLTIVSHISDAYRILGGGAEQDGSNAASVTVRSESDALILMHESYYAAVGTPTGHTSLQTQTVGGMISRLSSVDAPGATSQTVTSNETVGPIISVISLGGETDVVTGEFFETAGTGGTASSLNSGTLPPSAKGDMLIFMIGHAHTTQDVEINSVTNAGGLTGSWEFASPYETLDDYVRMGLGYLIKQEASAGNFTVNLTGTRTGIRLGVWRIDRTSFNAKKPLRQFDEVRDNASHTTLSGNFPLTPLASSFLLQAAAGEGTTGATSAPGGGWTERQQYTSVTPTNFADRPGEGAGTFYQLDWSAAQLDGAILVVEVNPASNDEDITVVQEVGATFTGGAASPETVVSQPVQPIIDGMRVYTMSAINNNVFTDVSVNGVSMTLVENSINSPGNFHSVQAWELLTPLPMNLAELIVQITYGANTDDKSVVFEEMFSNGDLIERVASEAIEDESGSTTARGRIALDGRRASVSSGLYVADSVANTSALAGWSETYEAANGFGEANALYQYDAVRRDDVVTGFDVVNASQWTGVTMAHAKALPAFDGADDVIATPVTAQAIAANHTPSRPVNGVYLISTSNGDGTHTIDSMSYGGVSIPSANISSTGKTTGEDGVVAIGFLGQGVPYGGVQRAEVVWSSALQEKTLYVVGVTAEGDLEIVSSDGVASDLLDDPSVILGGDGRHHLAALGLISGFGSPVNVTPQTGWTEQHEYDAGVQTIYSHTLDAAQRAHIEAGVVTSPADDAILHAVSVALKAPPLIVHQTEHARGTVGSPTVTYTLQNTYTAGRSMIVVIDMPGQAITSFVDDGGNDWVLDQSTDSDQHRYYHCNKIGTPPTQFTIGVAGTSQPHVSVFEVSNLDTENPVDFIGPSQQSGFGTTHARSYDLAADDQLVVGIISDSSSIDWNGADGTTVLKVDTAEPRAGFYKQVPFAEDDEINFTSSNAQTPDVSLVSYRGRGDPYPITRVIDIEEASTGTSSTTSPAIAYPICRDGDLLVLSVTPYNGGGGEAAINDPAGFTQREEQISAFVGNHALFTRDCDGTESGTFTLSASEAKTWDIQLALLPQAQYDASALAAWASNGSTVDAPSVTPTELARVLAGGVSRGFESGGLTMEPPTNANQPVGTSGGFDLVRGENYTAQIVEFPNRAEATAARQFTGLTGSDNETAWQLAVVPRAQAWSRIQGVDDIENRGVASIATISVPSVAAGSLLVLQYGGFDVGANGHAITSVTDDNGNTWQRAVREIEDAGADSLAAEIWYAENANAGTTIVTITPTSDVDLYYSASVSEYAGGATTGVLGTTGGRNGGAEQPQVSTDAAATAGSLLVGVANQEVAGDLPWTPPTGFTNEFNAPNGNTDQPVSADYDLAADAGIASLQWARSASGSHLSVVAEFLLEGSPTGNNDIASTGATSITPSADLTGEGTLSASTAIGVTSSADLTGAQAEMSASVALTMSSSADLTGVGTLEASPIITGITPSADLFGIGNLAATGLTQITPTADLVGNGELSSISAMQIVGDAILSGIGQLSVAANLTLTPNAFLSGGTDPNISATGTLVSGSSADLTGAGELAASTPIGITSSAELTDPGNPNLTVSGTISISGSPDLTAEGTLASQGAAVIVANAAMESGAAISATASSAMTSSANLTGAGEIETIGVMDMTHGAILNALGSLASSGPLVMTPFALLLDGNSDFVDGVDKPSITSATVSRDMTSGSPVRNITRP